LNHIEPPVNTGGAAAQILQAATRLFAEQGYAAASMAEIARAAGMSKSGVFHHFPSKHALYREVLSQIAREARWVLGDSEWRPGSLESTLASIVERHQEVLARNPDLERLIRRELIDQGNAEQLALVAEVLAEPFERLTALLHQAQQGGELRPGVNPALVAFCLIGIDLHLVQCQSLLERLPGGDFARDHTRFAADIAALFVRGAGTSGPSSSTHSTSREE
jgi:TetR/AcrR family transcriptional regulator